MKKPVFCALAALIAASVCVASAGCGGKNGSVVEITVDGGGQNAHFNSTKSMIYDKYANPYPYNTLEKIAEEWNKENKGKKSRLRRLRSTTTAKPWRPRSIRERRPRFCFTSAQRSPRT